MKEVSIERNPVIHPGALNSTLISYIKASLYEDINNVLKEGADPNSMDSLGRSAIMVAIPNVKMIQMLHSAGADIEMESKSGVTPLSWAKAHNYPAGKACVDYLEYMISQKYKQKDVTGTL